MEKRPPNLPVRGFGFVETPAKAEARAAIRKFDFDLKELNGRFMTVGEARR